MRGLLVLAMTLLVVLASTPGTLACSPSYPPCYRGEYQGCTCASGAHGYQACNVTEDGFQGCVCDGTTPGADGGRDSGRPCRRERAAQRRGRRVPRAVRAERHVRRRRQRLLHVPEQGADLHEEVHDGVGLPRALARLHPEQRRVQGTMRKRLSLALVLGSALVASLAHAQEPAPAERPRAAERCAAPSDAPPSDAPPPAADQAPVQREPAEVRVIGGKADSLQRVPGSGTLVTKKEIERAAPLDLAEMLRRVPGVQARQEYGGGGRLDISIRGLDAGRSRRILMLEDGIPISINPYSEPDMYYAPPVERMRGIEVVKGSGNILFGPQTLAGTINFLTLAPPDHRTVAADVDAGSYGYVRGLASYGDSYGGARYVVQVLHRRGDGFHDQGFQSTNGLAKIAFDTGPDGEAMVKLGFHRDESGSEDVGFTRDMYKAEPRRATLSPSSHLVLDRYDASLTHEQRLSASTKLKTLLYGYTTDRIWRRQTYSRSPSTIEDYDRIVGDPTVHRRRDLLQPLAIASSTARTPCSGSSRGSSTA